MRFTWFALSVALAALPALASPNAPSPDSPVPDAPSPRDPATRAKAIAERLTISRHALREARRAAAGLIDGPLRSAVEAQLQAPWLPPEAFVLAHPAEAEQRLRSAGLLAADQHLAVPRTTFGFAAAPGGTCPNGHHSYPGGLAVHSWTNLQAARGLAAAFKDSYGIALDDGQLVAAALWHDSLKAQTLPWDESGNCPAAEAQLAGTALHHTLGIAAAILRRLPAELVLVIASAHAPPTAEHLAELCRWLDAGSILATGEKGRVPCPSLTPGAARPPIEAYVNNFADSDFGLTVTASAWYAERAPKGWARYEALAQDGSDLLLWFKSQPH